MSRRAYSFNHSPFRPDRRYIDFCLADNSRKRIQSRNPDNSKQLMRTFPDSSSPIPCKISSVQETCAQSGKPSRKTNVARAVSFTKGQSERECSPNGNIGKVGRCPSCQTHLVVVPSSSLTWNTSRKKPRAQSFSLPTTLDVKTHINKTINSEAAHEAKTSTKRHRKATHRRKETVKYQLSIGFTVKRNIKSQRPIVDKKDGIYDSETTVREVEKSTKLSFNHAHRQKRKSCSSNPKKNPQQLLSSEQSRPFLNKGVIQDGPTVQLKQSKSSCNPAVKRYRPTSVVVRSNRSKDIQNNRILRRNQSYQQSISTFGNDLNSMKTEMSKKPVRIHLLNNDSVVLVFETKATVQQLFDQVCSIQYIKETQFFGLSTVVDNEKWFMDHKHRIARYAPKEWGKEIRRRASDIAVSSSAVLTVQFHVQFYVEHPKLISDKVSRYLYYLQMKKNVLKSTVLLQDEVLFTLASYGLQADLGDHNPTIHTKQYFRPEDYFPSWFVDKWGRDYLLSHLPALHADHSGKTAYESQALYIQQASSIDDVPVHYYRLSKNKKDTKSSVLLGVFHQGIRIHYGNPEKSPKMPWKLEFEFMWNKVGRLFFTGKRFEIYPDDLPSSRRLIYYTGSHARSKYLLHFLRETHSIYLTLSPYAQQMRKLDGKRARRKFRESYISGQNLNADSVEAITYGQQSVDKEYGINKEKQDEGKLGKTCYQSMTSHGSSHTSGIESDSKQRTEGEEDEEEVANYADDFDPIERDQRKESVFVTEDHLSAPPPKSLSVSNLEELPVLDTAASDRKISTKGAISERNYENSTKPSRDSTLTGEDLCIPAALPLASKGSESNSDQKTPKYSSMSSDNRDDTLKNGVPFEILMNAVMRNAEDAVIRNSENEATSGKKVKKRVSSKSKREHRKQVKSLTDNSTQTSPLHAAGIFYCDDFNTVPRKPRERSKTEIPQSSRESRTAAANKRHQKHLKPNQNHQQKHTVKRYSSFEPNYDSHSESRSHYPHDSFHWRQPSQSADPTVSSERCSTFSDSKGKCPHGNGISIPSNFQSNFDPENDRPSAFVTVARPKKYAEASERGYYTVSRGYDRHGYAGYTASTGRKEKRHSYYDQFYYTDSSDNYGRSSSVEEDDFTQKMSEVCMRTLSAQRRKLSDSKFSQRMDSGRGSLRTTTDDSSSCMDMSPTTHVPPDFIPFPPAPATKSAPAPYDLLRTPYIENYNEVIV